MSRARFDAGQDLLSRYSSDQRQFNEEDKIILDHGLTLFDLHAKQRMEGFRSYLIASAILFAAFASMWKENAYDICAMLAFAFLVTNVGFYTIDRRALQLVKYAEEMLWVPHAKLRNTVDWDSQDRDNVAYFNRTDDESYLINIGPLKLFRITYRDVFNKIFLVMSVMAILGVAISVYRNTTVYDQLRTYNFPTSSVKQSRSANYFHPHYPPQA